MHQLELWGGIECTVNRVGDRYFDQVRRSGHHHRLDDLARFAAVGCRAIRYPILWERVVAERLTHHDFRWTDERLAKLRDLGVRPIATLLHHGSGPRDTSLLDPAFAEHFADYAAVVARRYPWVRDYTPINEPLTTARFSTLYGHWYPHHRSDRSFVAALIHQLRATVLAMARIREVTPAARLIQTEDAGRTYARPTLEDQAHYENCRRWLTFDLLAGRVCDRHPLWRWLLDCGASPAALTWFLEHPCAADVIGLNYYLTSDRYLDDRVQRHPHIPAGGNGRDVYVDVEAVRARECPAPSHHRLIDEAWSRYRSTIAITETHAGCTREEQLRWFASAWRAAAIARTRGIDVEAVTMWALLGSFDWDSLVTREDGHYEVGAFDVRGNHPRPTALAKLARALATSAALDPLASQPGWWQRVERIRRPRRISNTVARIPPRASPILVTGATGTLGRAMIRACMLRGLEVVPLARTQLDITDPHSIARVVETWQPWAIVNTAGYVRVDEAERDRDACLRLNAHAAADLARLARKQGTRLVTFSTDLVFDGKSAEPYSESSRTRPLNAYGRSKLEAEWLVGVLMPDALIVRTAAFFGPDDRTNFLTRALEDILDGREVKAPNDLFVSPTYVPHLANAVLDLLIDGESGLWHLANVGAMSWATFAASAARRAGLDAELIRGMPASSLGFLAPRPRNSALASERGRVMPALELAIEEYLSGTQHIRSNRSRQGRP